MSAPSAVLSGVSRTFPSGNGGLGVTDLAIAPGEMVALIGPSGSGKTTLLRILSFLDAPDAGTITLDGNHFNFPLNRRERITAPWPRVTVVFQQLFLWPHLTLRQNITLPLSDRDSSETQTHLEALVTNFDMKGFIDRYPNETSLGQRQRAALARALMLKPEFILLDEITSALDVEQTSAILSHLQTLRDEGIGILIITHLMGFARRAADRIVFMDEGLILESGGTEVIICPENERIQRFLSVVESAS